MKSRLSELEKHWLNWYLFLDYLILQSQPLLGYYQPVYIDYEKSKQKRKEPFRLNQRGQPFDPAYSQFFPRSSH